MQVKKILPGLVALLLLLVQNINSYASHIYGGELLYTYVSGNTYKVVLTLYGDCSASASIFNTLYTAEPQIRIYNETSFYDTLVLHADSVGIEVSPVCASQLSQTSCNGGTLPGVKKFVYSSQVTLSGTSDKWQFFFAGDLGSASGAGRSSQITNINMSGSSVMQLVATLNNTIGNNSSPEYSTIPTPYYCINIAEQYNQGAIDPDNDSLSFSLVPAVNAYAANPLVASVVTYMSPFTYSNPMSVSAFGFNSLNGQMNFTPDATQDALIVNQVSEYRGGVLIGTSEREMTFIVTDNCSSSPPAVTINNLHGGAVTDATIINVCNDITDLSFNVAIANTGGDTVEITPHNIPTGAMLNISGNNTPSPAVSFSWDVATIALGVYTFYLTVKTDHCPISNTQTIAYTINLVPLPTISEVMVSPTQCTHKALVQYTLSEGFLPRTVVVLQGTSIAGVFTDSTGIVTDSLNAGNYTVNVNSDSICNVSISFAVADSGALPLSPVSESFCVGDSSAAVYIPVFGSTATVTWYDSSGNVLSGAPVPNTSAPATYTWSVVEQYKVCTSGVVPVTAVVHSLPAVDVTSNPTTICYGDSIYLAATGGVDYVWKVIDSSVTIQDDANGHPFVRITTPAELEVYATDQYHCSDSAMVTYANIQPCCNFSYPNAFTPNNDGTNDGFRIVTYGNMMHYRLAIYNRWGQLVFLTFDPYAKWDGKYHGVPCEMGTYYYYFKAQCLTGRSEEHVGDITLIR